MAGEIVEAEAEGIQLGGIDAETGGHGMTAVAQEEAVALSEGISEVEAFDAAAGAAPDGAIAAEDDGGTIIALKDAGGDDADDADMPGALAFDDHEIALGIKAGVEFGEEGIGHGLFDLLPLSVAGIEAMGDAGGGGEIVGDQQIQGFAGILEAAGGVESGAEEEADFITPDGSGDLGDLAEGLEAGALGLVEALESGADQDAVLVSERHQIGDGAERDQIEAVFEIEGDGIGFAGVAGGFKEGVGEFEGEAG
jgi:hypothetical protein